MKIIDLVCSAGRTGFYFDDQRAIKKGAGHDGVFYIGEPVTEGFRAVRQAGESISVMLILEDGQIAYGDCAAVQYSGAGGRDPLFLAEEFIPVVEKYIKPHLVGREADNFRELSHMMEAIEIGYVSEERLDDAVSRILNMKEKLGLFETKKESVKEMTEKDKIFVRETQQKTAEKSITLVRDKADIFPLTLDKYKKIMVIPITHYMPALDEAKLLCEELRNKGFEVEYKKEGLEHIKGTLAEEDQIDACDLVIYALFSRSFRPIGFLDFHSKEAMKVWRSLEYGVEKTIVVSFGSPYFGEQYFERAVTYVNAYSMLSPSVKAFVRAAVGEIPFSGFSPVNLQ